METRTGGGPLPDRGHPARTASGRDKEAALQPSPGDRAPPPLAPLSPGGLLALQGLAGNRAVRAMLAPDTAPPVFQRRHSAGPVVQRLFLPVERVGPDEEERALAGYERLLRARLRAVRDLANRVPDPKPESSIFAKAFRGFFDKRKIGENDIAWKVLEYVVSSANDLERKARATGAHIATAPSALSTDEREDIWTKVRHDFPLAQKLCGRLSSDGNIMSQVFAAEVVDRAREGMVEIGSQLALYLGGNKIRLDTDRALDSSGTILQNRGNAAGPEAIMTVTKAWADLDPHRRLTTLVHEASHGAVTGTRDKGYLDTWAFEALAPEEQLANAPHYEAAAEMFFGVRQTAKKPLTTNVRAEKEPKLRTLLGRADAALTERRLYSDRVLAVLEASRTTRHPVTPPPDGFDMVARTGAVLELPYAPHRGRLRFIKATNLDIELFGVFREWMKSMHNVLNDVTQFEVSREELVTLSGDRHSLTVPARWALAATPEDVGDLLQALARCLPAVGNWDHDVLVHAMNALKRA